MKVLVVSLLRLGDIIMTAPVLSALRRKYSNCEIHILINNQFATVGEILPQVDHIHLFPRGLLQESLTDGHRPLLDAFYQLDRFAAGLRNEEFDMVLNLTHNRLSGYLCSLIEGREAAGLAIGAQGQVSFGSPWFRYMNERADAIGKDCFHYCDLFLFGSGFKSADREFKLRTTENGEREALDILAGTSSPIFIQPLTSDEKKNWGVGQWIDAMSMLRKSGVGHPLYLLGAPFERRQLVEFQLEAQKKGIAVELAICSLAGAYSLLRRGRLLITCDTAIKHLAAATDCPVIELSLGSSDWRRTGIYKNNAFILQPKTQCHPCIHSGPCHQNDQICARDLTPSVLTNVVWHMIDGTIKLIPDPSVEIIKTFMSPESYWQGLPLASGIELEDIKSMLDRATLKMLLSGEHNERLANYGSAAVEFNSVLRANSRTVDPQRWLKLLEAVEMETKSFEIDVEDAERRFKSFLERSRKESTVDLKAMRQLQQKLEDCKGRLHIRRKLLRTIKETAAEAP